MQGVFQKFLMKKSGPCPIRKNLMKEVEDGRIDFNHVNFSYRKNSTEDTFYMILIFILMQVRQLVLLVVQDAENQEFCEPYKAVFMMLLKVPYVLAEKM